MTKSSNIRILIILGLLVLAVVAPIGQKNYIIYVLTSWLIFTIAAMGLNLTLGYAGQISLAQASFMAIGAYITALLTLAGWHWIVAMPLALFACFVIGLLLGYPALRVKGHFLAFVTLAFNTLVFLVLRNEDWLTGGSIGLVGMPRPDFGLFSTMKQLPFYYFTLAVTAFAALAMWGIVRSPWGRAFKALRENPVRAESLGVDTRRITLLAFAIGSTYGGLAGTLITPLVQFIEPGSFALAHSLRILLMVIVGGAGYFFGPWVGAGVVILLPEVLRFTQGYYLIIYSALVIVMLIFVPSGLIGVGARIRDKIWPKQQVRADLAEGASLK
ncbi:branched-chain amino acid ABC transporter permease [Rhizobium lentis]|uniref:Branched-chain amino acid transport system permease protein n=1 Tax=Rhizobium lentis TaxID=1138194 RepID=A0A7W8XIC1_9HYPH|nr:branched-chain amino acid ABC transporter permease [Rhizobium lentis]MBB4576589.1 branched-chain amino acid transport system permease protein [Rhizobium lentis]MBB5553044.1 branched-chain amino acid transport system permease protein [Rhizobium lentis]MBB5563437.1 branched-chain amino acid transport system permease protein [Rhizobium lentis]MBB5569975.1 branched-chain amino acid transport system permease protein [Rhizobium lentis]